MIIMINWKIIKKVGLLEEGEEEEVEVENKRKTDINYENIYIDYLLNDSKLKLLNSFGFLSLWIILFKIKEIFLRLFEISFNELTRSLMSNEFDRIWFFGLIKKLKSLDFFQIYVQYSIAIFQHLFQEIVFFF